MRKTDLIPKEDVVQQLKEFISDNELKLSRAKTFKAKRQLKATNRFFGSILHHIES